MLYHASQTPSLSCLIPQLSNHGIPLVYLSAKRENVLVYLSNAVEKYCRETGFSHQGTFRKWGSYGFAADGLLQLDEYYPGATEETYRGVSGYLYGVEDPGTLESLPDIPFVFTSAAPLKVASCEWIPDAYEALLQAAEEGKIHLTRYEDNSREKLDWIERSIRQEYCQSQDHPEYRAFLKSKFGFLRSLEP